MRYHNEEGTSTRVQSHTLHRLLSKRRFRWSLKMPTVCWPSWRRISIPTRTGSLSLAGPCINRGLVFSASCALTQNACTMRPWSTRNLPCSKTHVMWWYMRLGTCLAWLTAHTMSARWMDSMATTNRLLCNAISALYALESCSRSSASMLERDTSSSPRFALP